MDHADTRAKKVFLLCNKNVLPQKMPLDASGRMRSLGIIGLNLPTAKGLLFTIPSTFCRVMASKKNN
jgi:hypothetical protein